MLDLVAEAGEERHAHATSSASDGDHQTDAEAPATTGPSTPRRDDAPEATARAEHKRQSAFHTPARSSSAMTPTAISESARCKREGRPHRDGA